MAVKIKVNGITKIFGNHPERALELLKEGVSKEDILKKTKQAVGCVDVTFDVDEGEILVVMGLSGSGKSTLIRCINRLNEPTTGAIEVDGEDVIKLDEHGLMEFRRKKFGFVFQHFALFPHRTVRENTEYGLEVQGVEPAERAEKANKALAQVGLDGWGDNLPGQLSGGMQQRVGLARALAVDPDILLMDEAFSALDPLIRRGMQDELLTLQEKVQKTIVFITHDLDEALRIGDRIAILRDGRVVQEGTTPEIVMHPADDYIADFVKDINRARVLRVKAVMDTATDGARGVAIPAQTTLEEALTWFHDDPSARRPVTRDGEGVVGAVGLPEILRAIERPNVGPSDARAGAGASVSAAPSAEGTAAATR